MSVLPSSCPLWLGEMARADWFRRDPLLPAPPGRYTEWMHFCVLGTDLQVLINLSLHGRPGRGLEPRLLIAIHQDGWVADVEGFHPSQVDIRAGRFDASVGENHLTLRPDGYHLRLRSQRLQLRLDLHLIPEAPLLLAPNASLPGGSSLSWLAAPRLSATGTVEISRKTVFFVNAPAYHDHNWGKFDWAGDFSWDWGFVLPEAQSGTALIFLRMMDRARHRLLCQGVWVWRNGELIANFRDEDVTFASTGFVRSSGMTVVPKVLSSAVAGEVTGVPKLFSWEANRQGNSLRARMTPGPPMRLVAPSDGHVTLVHESVGQVEIEGTIGGEDIRWSSTAVLEVANG